MPVGCLKLLQHLDIEETYRQACRRLRKEPRLLKAVHSEYARLGKLSRDEKVVWPSLVVGCDEVGRGPIAGPLVASAVAFHERPWIPYLKDSKKLKPEERESLVDWIQKKAAGVGIGVVTVEEINRGNLHHLSLEAMRRALAKLELRPSLVLVDGRFPLPHLSWPQKALVKGDRRSLTIAAASIVAKVARDQMMVELDSLYPGYRLAEHKGYGTSHHLEALRRLGPSPIHRTSFAPVQEASQGLLEF